MAEALASSRRCSSNRRRAKRALPLEEPEEAADDELRGRRAERLACTAEA